MFLAFIFVGLCFGERRLLQPSADQQMSALITHQALDVNEGLFVQCYIYHNYLNPTSDFWTASGSVSTTLMSAHIANEPWYVAISSQGHAPFSELTVDHVANQFSGICSGADADNLQQIRTTLNCAISAPGVPACPETPEDWAALVPECATALDDALVDLANGVTNDDPTPQEMQQKMQCARIILSTIFIGGIVDLTVYHLQQKAQNYFDLAAANAISNPMLADSLNYLGTVITTSLVELGANTQASESLVQAAIASNDISFTLVNFNLCSVLQLSDYSSTIPCPAAA